MEQINKIYNIVAPAILSVLSGTMELGVKDLTFAGYHANQAAILQTLNEAPLTIATTEINEELQILSG